MSVTDKPTAEVPDFVRDHYDVDHVTLDIIENTLGNTRYEMDRVVETTAVSPVIREQSDQFPLTADRNARMVVLAAHHHGFFGRLFGTDVATEVERELGTGVVVVVD